MTESTPAMPMVASPYEVLGGAAGVQRLAHRFYELMDELPEACTVRKMHPESLHGSEENLFEFLSGWFGGPSLYIEKKDTHACACATTLMPWVPWSVTSGCCA